MKQEVMMPSYMAHFQCIADQCEETCCEGWYIEIDEATYKKYKKVKHPELRKRLDKELVAKKGQAPGSMKAKIKLKNNRCAFLDEHKLCDIYKGLGENYLSETCRMYPRNTNALGKDHEISLALSCPEAARLILLGDEAITFRKVESESLPIVGAQLNIDSQRPRGFIDKMQSMRSLLIHVLQDAHLNFWQKWQYVERLMQDFTYYQAKKDIKGLEQYLSQDKRKHYSEWAAKTSTFNKIAGEEEAQQMMITLAEMRDKKKWPSTRYETCYHRMVDTLQCPMSHTAYSKKVKQFEECFMKNYPHVLEHYFVNYIYERVVPVDQSSPLESFRLMNRYFELIRLHIMGNLDDNGQITSEEVVCCIQGFSRVFDHNPLYMSQLEKSLR